MYKGKVAGKYQQEATDAERQRVPANNNKVAKVSSQRDRQIGSRLVVVLAPALVLAPITLARSASSGRETKKQTDW